MMKILVIGDPHGHVDKIPLRIKKEIDLIIVVGDIGKADLARKYFFENVKRKQKGLGEIELKPKIAKKIYEEVHFSTIKILKDLSKIAPVYFISGNVGIYGREDAKKSEKKYGVRFPCTLDEIKKMKKVHLVKNSIRKIGKLRVGFLEYFVDASWVKEFKPSDYKEKLVSAKIETEKARRILKNFGKLDILVCHQPPYGILDKVSFKAAPKNWQGKSAGSLVILNYIKKNKPRFVFCGHIHEGEGFKKFEGSEIYNLGCSKWKLFEI